MLEFLVLVLFSVALVIANIYCFAKKKYLYLFIPCMLFLPNYYAIDISESLPLMNATRIMYFYFFIYAVVNRKRKLNIRLCNLKNIFKEYWFLALYFILRIVSNLYYVTTYSQAIKTIFAIVFEQMLLFVSIYFLAPTKEEILKLIKVIVWTAAAFFVLGIMESIFSLRIFDALNTASRHMVNMHYVRLGLLRATTTLVAPAVYGNMCILMFPLILFLYELTRSKKYLLIFGLDVLAIIHSGSRSDEIFLIVVLVAYLLFVLRGKQRRMEYFKNAIVVTAAILAFAFCGSIISSDLRYFYVGNVKSVLNEVGFDFDLNEGAPINSSGFGVNYDGSASRIKQLSGLYYVAKINPIFGLGSAAQRRGDVKYGWVGEKSGTFKWIVANTYDLGIVEIFCDEGLLGLLGMCAFIFHLMKKSRNDNYSKLAVFCYLLTTLSTGNMFYFLMMYAIVLPLNDTQNQII